MSIHSCKRTHLPPEAVGIWDSLAGMKCWSFGLPRGFRIGMLQCHCEETGWVQTYMLGPGPWLWSGRTRGAFHPGIVCSKPRLLGTGSLNWPQCKCTEVAPAGHGSMAKVVWKCCVLRFLVASAWIPCAQLGLHPGAYQCISPLFSLLWGCDGETPAVALRGHSWHWAVFISSDAMLHQSCCAPSKAELAWEQFAHVYMALTPTDLTRQKCPCSWEMRIQMWVSRS